MGAVHHYSDLTWASWFFEAPINRLFVQQHARLATKGTWKLHNTLYLHFYVYIWNHRVIRGFHHKRPIMPKAFPSWDVIKWKHFPRNWPFVRGIHRSLVNSPHKYQSRGALMFCLIRVWANSRVNNRDAGDLTHEPMSHYNRGAVIDNFAPNLCYCVAILYAIVAITASLSNTCMEPDMWYPSQGYCWTKLIP